MKALPLLAPLAALAACVTVEPADGDALDWARLGQTVEVGGPAKNPLTLTPLRLIEDSRCPQGVQCVWAGRVVVSATISTPTMKLTRDLTLGEPFAVADGTLTLAEVRPARERVAGISPGDYRLGFHFDGGT